MAVKEAKLKEKYIRWFSELRKEDVKTVGGKAANLGEMSSLKLPVPPGFATTAEAYRYFLEETGLDVEIYGKLAKLNVDDTEELEKTTKEIRDMIESAELPKELKAEIEEAYETISIDKDALKNASKTVMSIMKLSDPAFVAVRSSATAEDSSVASFAGQQETFLNVKGKDEVIKSVKGCYASLFTARSVFYRVKKGFKHEDVLIAVVVQRMINSDKSGVIFSRNPVTNDEHVVVEAVFGLGEGIVSGRIQPDTYVVSRELQILDKKIADKEIALVRSSSGETMQAKLTEEKSKSQVLSDYEIKRAADYALKLEEHYGLPQDIEFAVEAGDFYIVQTRPITTLGMKITAEKVEGEAILSGLPASPGVGSGVVKVIKDLSDLDKIVEGDVLVTIMTNPDMVVTMQKCSAIVTNEGGMTAHAAIVSREMGIPAVVGTKKATEVLKDGMIITVDGSNGKIYKGKPETLKTGKVEILPVLPTKTKIKVTVDLPSFAERAALTKCMAVGLTRLEDIIGESGKHPFGFLKAGKMDEYEGVIYEGIKTIAEYFDEVWVRTSDIRTDEFRNLEGAPKKIEANPMLGMHGIRASLKYPEILKAELRAMKRVANSGKIIGILTPQVISLEEVKQLKQVVKEIGGENLKVGVMVETPAAVQIIEDLCKEGIKFISFGTNDLTQYTLAIDRGNEECQYLYDEMNPAVLNQLAFVIKICKKYGVETSICGQAGSKKEMAEFLVRHGIDSISVNADKAKEISEFVRNLEEKGLRGSANTPDNKINNVSLADRRENKNIRQQETKVAQPIQSEEKKAKPEKVLHSATCTECRKSTEVPFVPDGKRPVYCKECFKNRSKPEQKPAAKEEKAEEIVEEVEKEVKEQKAEETKKEWEDVNFGIDIFASSTEEKKIEKDIEESLKEEEKEETAEEIIEEAGDEEVELKSDDDDEDNGKGEVVLDIF